MAYDYEELYRTTPNALGEASAEFLSLLEGLPRHLTILDMGCGQGRDAIPLSQQGFEIWAVDPSPSAIAALNDYAQSHKLPIHAQIGTLMDFQTQEKFDIVLLDRVLHMLGNEEAVLAGFEKMLGHLAPNGYLLISDEPRNVKKFLDRLEEQRPWQILKKTRKSFLAVFNSTQKIAQ